jgi:hypothetical protein
MTSSWSVKSEILAERKAATRTSRDLPTARSLRTKRLLSFAIICFSIIVAVHSASAHPGAAIVVDAKGQVYFVDTGHGVWMVNAAGSSSISVAPRFI